MKEADIRNSSVLNRYLAMVEIDAKKLFDKQKFVNIACPMCSGGEHLTEFEKGDFKYVTCSACGTLFANPRPTQEQLDRFYSVSDSSKFWVEEFFMPFAEARRQKIFIPRAKQFAKDFSEYHDKRIGDIGAGFGLFLEELKKLWTDSELYAIEPSLDMVSICKNKGLKVIPKMFEDLDEKDGKFDFLCCFELFEHLSSPRAFLEKANRALENNGKLLITTLNGQGFDIQLLWEKHKNVSPPHHLNFANPQSICILLQDCGFEVEELTTPGRLDWDIVEKMITEDKVDLGRWWNGVCNLSENAKTELQEWISKNNLSSHLRVVAKKVRQL